MVVHIADIDTVEVQFLLGLKMVSNYLKYNEILKYKYILVKF